MIKAGIIVLEAAQGEAGLDGYDERILGGSWYLLTKGLGFRVWGLGFRV